MYMYPTIQLIEIHVQSPNQKCLVTHGN